jgi:EmrB/QacA subfamily drug resistance transporter
MSRQKLLILVGTIFASGAGFFMSSALSIAATSIQTDFNIGINQVQFIVNAYTLALAVLILTSGSISDLFGVKKTFLFGIGIFGLGALLSSLTQSALQLTITQVVQGIGAAFMIPGSLAVININFSEKSRGAAIGIWSGLSGGVAALAPLLGGAAIDLISWRAMFWLQLPLVVIAFALILYFCPTPAKKRQGKVDIIGAILIIIGLLGISYGLIQGPVDNWQQSLPFIAIGIGFVTLVLFAIWEIKQQGNSPLIPFNLFKNKNVLGANLATFLLYFALSGTIFYSVINFQQLRDLSASQTGLYMLPVSLTITFLSGVGGAIADRYSARLPMTLGPIIVAIGSVIFILADKHSNYLTSFFPGLLLFGLGMSLVIAPLTKTALRVAEEQSGVASGLNNAVSRIAGFMAVAIMGSILLTVFSSSLESNLDQTDTSGNVQSQIFANRDRLGEIDVGSTAEEFNLNKDAQRSLINAIDDSIEVSYDAVMIINTVMILGSALVSAVFITSRE